MGEIRLTPDRVINGFVMNTEATRFMRVSEIQYIGLVRDLMPNEVIIMAYTESHSMVVAEYPYDSIDVTIESVRERAMSDLKAFILSLRGAK